MDFLNRHNYNDIFNVSMLSIDSSMSQEDIERLKRIRRAWNFYDGYHWEEIPPTDSPEITENYCRTFVNKFVAFEFGKEFVFETRDGAKEVMVAEGMTLYDFLTQVWTDNQQNKFCVELGQMKSITGDAWVQVKYFSPEELDDPFGEYPKGRIRIMVIPSSVVFPIYDVHDKEKLVQVTIQYPIEIQEKSPVLRRVSIKKVVYKQIWTKDKVEVWQGGEQLLDLPNKYGKIPFEQIKNFPVAGRSEGLSDLEDLIPLNVELNMKKSNISEIIDYHSAPVTVVFGAKVSSLEKGANKLWGGLPKDAKVENLELKGDLGASVEYMKNLKLAMSEVGCIPEGSLGGQMAISNTSGVALQYVNMPLIERTRIKRMCSEEGLQRINKLILLVALKEGLIIKPESISASDFFSTDVTLPDTMPKDMLLELQQIEQEMKLSIESRKGAMQRLGREDIDAKLEEVDKDKKDNPDAYGIKPEMNSGFTNGQTPIEQVRRETNGANKA
jgi:hypothetical protein